MRIARITRIITMAGLRTIFIDFSEDAPIVMGARLITAVVPARIPVGWAACCAAQHRDLASPFSVPGVL
jgi:hypothetical protein